MTVAYSLENLKKISNSLVGDQLAKVDYFLAPKCQIFQCLLSIEQSDGVELKNAKLDLLYTLLHLEPQQRDIVGTYYFDIVSAIYKSMSLASSFTKNNSSTNYKYIKLLNLCAGVYPNCGFPDLQYLQNGFIQLVNHKFLRSKCKIDEVVTIIELLKLFLLVDEKNCSDFNKSKFMEEEREVTETSHYQDFKMAESLEHIIVKISSKYLDQISLKYIVRLKVSRPASPSSVKNDPFDNKGVDCTRAIPKKINISNMYDSSLLSLALLLYLRYHYMIPGDRKLRNDATFKMFVLGLLKSNDVNIRCVALKFLLQPYFTEDKKWEDTRTLEKILPYLVKSFNYDPLPWWFDPFDMLDSLIVLYNEITPMNNPVLTTLAHTNVIFCILSRFAQCLSLPQHNEATLKTTTKFIKICASFAASDEKYRLLLLNGTLLLNHLEYGLESHITLIQDFISLKNEIKETTTESHSMCLPPIYDHDFVAAWLLLLKSFSRSVSALRTTLKRNKIAQLLLQILSKTYTLTKECYFAGQDFMKPEIMIMGITLGSICNFVVEFSNLQSFMLRNGIIDIIEKMLTDPLFNSKKAWDDNEDERRIALQGIPVHEVKANSLWVLRHLMYNCQNEEKFQLLAKIPMNLILDFINDPCWAVQAQCFQLLRNLTCNSRKIVNILLEKFKDVEYEIDPQTGNKISIGSTYLFEFLAKKMRLLNPLDTQQKKAMEGILYIIVNLAAVNENKKQLVIEQDEILNIMSEILVETTTDSSSYGNDSNLKLACLWVLNNLLWNSSVSHYTQYAIENGLEPGHSPSDSENPQSTVTIGYNESVAGGYSRGKYYDEPDGDDSSSNANDDEDDDNDEGDDEGDEFVRTPAAKGSTSNVQVTRATVERCRKLVEVGLYDLVKKNITDESLSVREKARTLLYHMDLLLKVK
ncbi:CDG_1a_G0027180.mRNA.1.CDS.1 [Saccharomyces cerevisiae]|nr:CDG_1a_G0027180.mRNA.1.CDS.1 [Saccharomyces cerevisiae]CAI7243733.1 CDG_1a_G0027180.mRNA.1.CDS.1 [Saccharomyces cerevisiae]